MASADPDMLLGAEAVTPSNMVTTEPSMVTSTALGGEVTQHEGSPYTVIIRPHGVQHLPELHRQRGAGTGAGRSGQPGQS